MEAVTTPLYSNWSFWAVFIAAIAVILSQCPPVRFWFKKAKLDIEIYSKISITHKVGNPNLQIHLIVNNIGGRKVRVKGITASIKKDGKLVATLPAQNYLESQNNQNTLLFTPFSLNPSEEWAHIINLLNFFNREDEQEYRGLEAKILANYRSKKENSKQESQDLIEIDEVLVQPFHDFFNKHFIWSTGEYLLTVNINTDYKSADISKDYRFTIFESHTAQLKEITDKYKFGDGIWWNSALSNVIIDIKEA
ncbi:hypothetical protein [Legionella israelensis]|uniref:Transmembrane protein n=1 Tax=Legionella israelensis TaxID=454 RepID=A0A0W0V799_9GAMM|nr:hypothetical protein [Legionella israelensis]KTD15962.1 hypothetical protein Lisr_2205 [Legionella israelensis]QBS10481.1 hypothetical protein E4T55_11810 [Legionella israelensis]SCY60915.1 hypothetical protein SAMN02746069_03007 [Legionella israelensis DSM 19235]STX60110.1 Uncharacterised protein [Legionella israelensis]